MTTAIKNPLISRAWQQTSGVQDRALDSFQDVHKACANWLCRKEADGTIDPSARSKRLSQTKPTATK